MVYPGITRNNEFDHSSQFSTMVQDFDLAFERQDNNSMNENRLFVCQKCELVYKSGVSEVNSAKLCSVSQTCETVS